MDEKYPDDGGTGREDYLYSLTLLAVLTTTMDIFTSVILHTRGFVDANPSTEYLLYNHGVVAFVLINGTASIFFICFLTWTSERYLRGEGKWIYLPLMIYAVGRGVAALNNAVLGTIG